MDDPRTEHSRILFACHAPDAGARYRQGRLSGGGDLPDVLLPVLSAVRALRAGGTASRTVPRPAGTLRQPETTIDGIERK